MKKCLFLILFGYSALSAQVQLEIQYTGKSNSTEIELYKYKEYITYSTEKIGSNLSLANASSKKLNLDLKQPWRLLIKGNMRSRKFYVQPGNSFKLTFDDDSIYVQSEDKINEMMVLLESKITEYFKKNYEIDLDEEKNKRKRTLDLLEEFTLEINGLKLESDFQKKLFEYRLIDVISGTYYFLKDRKLFRQVESDFYFWK